MALPALAWKSQRGQGAWSAKGTKDTRTDCTEEGMSARRVSLMVLVASIAALAVGRAGAWSPAQEGGPVLGSSADPGRPAAGAGPADAAGWVLSLVDGAKDFGSHASAAIDPGDDRLYVSYYDASGKNLRLASPAWPGSGNCGPGNSWSCQTVDSSGDVGQYGSIAIWEGGGVWRLGIAYYDASHYALKYAQYEKSGGPGSWDLTTIAAGSLADHHGLYTSLKFDVTGKPHIAYHNETLAIQQGTLGSHGDAAVYARYVGGGSGGCTDDDWDCQAIETGQGAGKYASLDLNDSGEPRLAYYHAKLGGLRYGRPVGSGGNCGPDLTWRCDTVDTVTNLAEVEGTGPHVSLGAGSGSAAKIAYYDALHDALKVATHPVFPGAGNCGPGNTWNCTQIESVGASEGPMGLSLDLDAATAAVIAYHDRDDGGVLKIAQPISRLGLAQGNCGPVTWPTIHLAWQCDVVDDGVRGQDTHAVGQYAAVALHASDLATIAHYDATAGDLLVSTQISQTLVFSGTVFYAPKVGGIKPQPGVPVMLLGIPSESGAAQPQAAPDLLEQVVTGSNGQFELIHTLSPSYDTYQVVKEDPSGFAPVDSGAPLEGTALDPGTVEFADPEAGSHTGIQFTVGDPLPDKPPYHGRYLIVTSQAVVPALTEFIEYKEYLGYEMVVRTVEELDPQGKGGNYRRKKIRDLERSLEDGDGLDYVLLIGTHDTVPFMTTNVTIPDHSRNPDQDVWDGPCRSYAVKPNNCGWGGDWYYVDLYSDWDSNRDGIYGELIWGDPEAIQGWIGEGKLPAGYQPDTPPAFNVDVHLGRLLMDEAGDVFAALGAMMHFERDPGRWKKNSLLAGAMMSIAGEKWDPRLDPQGSYESLGPSTDTAYLMERAWRDFLEPAGYTRVRLYERENPYADLRTGTSDWPSDVDLTRENLVATWQAERYGLVNVAGHGSPWGIVRTIWAEDWFYDRAVQNPTAPIFKETAEYDHKDRWEIGSPGYLEHQDVGLLESPGGKAPILMAFACGTGGWNEPNNLPTSLLAERHIAAWIGGTSTVDYHAGWQDPADGGGQTLYYLITGALVQEGMPLGQAVWSALRDYFVSNGGSQWTHASWSLSFLNTDLYGDPSMRIQLGNGPDLKAPWPMFHYDWAGTGQTALLGPEKQDDWLFGITWSQPIAASPIWSPSPIIGRDRIVIGDSEGVVHSFNLSGPDWSYQTGGAIGNAPALSLDGTVYVKAQDGKLYAIDANGKLRWSGTIGEGNGSPKIGPDGSIYAGGSDHGGPGGALRHFLGRYNPIDGSLWAMAEVEGSIDTAPSIDAQDEIWVGTTEGVLYRMDLGPEVLWSKILTADVPLGPGLAVTDDVNRIVLAPSTDGTLTAWSEAYNATIWTISAGEPIHSAPAVSSDGVVFFGSRDGKVHAQRLVNGTKLWTFDTGGAVDSAPALDPLNVYVVGGNPPAVYALKRATGDLRWKVEIGGRAWGGSSPAIGPSRDLFVASSDGYLLRIAQKDQALPPAVSSLAPRYVAGDPKPYRIRILLSLPDPAARTRLERRVPGGEWMELATLEPGVAEFVDDSVLPDQQYEFRAQAEGGAVRGLQAAEPSEYSAPVTVRALPALPDTPPAPEVTAVSATELRLTWTPAVAGAASVEIQRRGPGDTGFQSTATVPGGVTEFLDRDLEPDSRYIYRLRASNESGDSPFGDRGKGSTLPRTLSAPQRVAVEPQSNTRFEVCWIPGGTDLQTIIARLPRGQTQLEPVATLPAGTTCYTDDTAYAWAFEYWTKHRNAAGTDESAWTSSGLVAAPDYDWGRRSIYLPLVLRQSR